MNLKMIRLKNQTEDLLLSITKICETLVEQTHWTAEEKSEYKLFKQRETFHFYPPISIEGLRMSGLTSLDLYNSIFIITEEKTNLYFKQILLINFHLKN